MSLENIGTQIARLRKEKGVTQEELANFVQVSPQAVSKWENGGVPDTELLPKIADFFEVSLDELLGRTVTDYKDLETAIISRLTRCDFDDVIPAMFRLCLAIQSVASGGALMKNYEDMLNPNVNRMYSSLLSDSGFAQMAINHLPYFLIVPDDENLNSLLEKTDFVPFFQLLADRNTFDALLFLNKRSSRNSFTPNLLVKNLSVSIEKACEIAEKLARFKILSVSTIEMDDETQEVYTLNPNPAFRTLLLFAYEMIKQPNSYFGLQGGRKNPILCKSKKAEETLRLFALWPK